VASAPPPILVFFDGVCGLCNRFVDFLIAHDRKRQLRYAPLQGARFREILARHPGLAEIDSIVVVENSGPEETVHTFSNASLAALSKLPGLWKAVVLLRLIPRFLRDAVYRLIAENRYRIWGRNDTCRLPGPEERDLFLD
jgi:predicted DCC family thiol-disulfide oxidoreductase YuxK